MKSQSQGQTEEHREREQAGQQGGRGLEGRSLGAGALARGEEV